MDSLQEGISLTRLLALPPLFIFERETTPASLLRESLLKGGCSEKNKFAARESNYFL